MADRDELLSHSYDGIQEYDNDLPRWWVWLFVLTIVWGVWRVVYYHMGPGLLQEEQLAVSMEALEKQRAAHAPASVKPVGEAELLAMAKDSTTLAAGKTLYEANCFACHLQQGQGLVGPNLTDEYWIHGGTIGQIHTVIAEGVPDKGMIAWKEKFTPEEINAVTAFIWTLRGTNPPNPKKPEGELVPFEPVE